MGKLAKLTKRQRDNAFRQQSQDSNKNIVTSESGTGAQSVANPTAPTWDSLLGKPATFPPSTHAITSHSDSPGAFAGNAGKAIIVKATEDGFEYGAAGGGGSAGFDYGSITTAAGSEFDQDWGGLV